MTWTAPATAVAGAALPAATWNATVVANLLETVPAKVTAAGQYPVATGLNSIAARTIGTAKVLTAETTTSGSYANLATSGPAVTCTTGTQAKVTVFAKISCSSSAYMGFAVSGATTVAADDEYAVGSDSDATGMTQGSATFYVTGLTAGSNVFTAKYRTDSGATGTFTYRKITVEPY